MELQLNKGSVIIEHASVMFNVLWLNNKGKAFHPRLERLNIAQHNRNYIDVITHVII